MKMSTKRITQHGAQGSNSNDFQPMNDQVMASTSTDANLTKRKATPASIVLTQLVKSLRV